jgi:hypothetical protein
MPESLSSSVEQFSAKPVGAQNISGRAARIGNGGGDFFTKRTWRNWSRAFDGIKPCSNNSMLSL